MNDHQLNRILKLIAKTGDKFVVADRDTDQVFVVMDMLSYEEMNEVYNEDWTPDSVWENMPDEFFAQKDDDFLEDEDEEKEQNEENEEKSENLSSFSENLPFSGKTEDLEEKWEENSYFPHIVEEKSSEEDPEFLAKVEDLAKKSEKNSFFTSLGDAIKDKTLAEVSENEPVVEEINPMSQEAPLSDDLEETTGDSTLEGEDADRFYLEPV